jgi:hypothetical protein
MNCRNQSKERRRISLQLEIRGIGDLRLNLPREYRRGWPSKALSP